MVSTRMPVSATIRRTIAARIANAARPNSEELLEELEAAEDALDSADTVVIQS